MLKTTMTSSKLIVRFISLSLKHTLRSSTVTTVAGFGVIFWTRTMPSTTAILRRLSAGSASVSMGSSSDCWYASFVYRVANFSSTWISLDLSLHGNTEPFGEKSALGVSVNS